MDNTTDRATGTATTRATCWYDYPCGWRHGWGVLIDGEEDGAAHDGRDRTDWPVLPGTYSVTVRRPARLVDHVAGGHLIGCGACDDTQRVEHLTIACTLACAAYLARPPEHTPLVRRYDEGMDQDRQLFTTAEAAAQLGITPDAVRAAVRIGSIAVVRINPRLHMVTQDAIEAYRRDHLGRVGRPPRKTRRKRAAAPSMEPVTTKHRTLDEGGAFHPLEEPNDGQDA